jgi:hypothetical protein
LDKAAFACGLTQICQKNLGVGCCSVVPNTIVNYSLMTPNSGYIVANDNEDCPITNWQRVLAKRNTTTQVYSREIKWLTPKDSF